MIDQYFPDDKDYLKNTFLDNVMSLAQVDGKQIGMPFCISAPIICYNPELFEKAGLDPAKGPETWDDIREYAKQITDKTGSTASTCRNTQTTGQCRDCLRATGANMLQDGKAALQPTRTSGVSDSGRHGIDGQERPAHHRRRGASRLSVTARSVSPAFPAPKSAPSPRRRSLA